MTREHHSLIRQLSGNLWVDAKRSPLLELEAGFRFAYADALRLVPLGMFPGSAPIRGTGYGSLVLESAPLRLLDLLIKGCKIVAQQLGLDVFDQVELSRIVDLWGPSARPRRSSSR